MPTDSRALTAARWLLMSTVLVPLLMWKGLFFPYIGARTIFFRTVVDLVVGIFIYLVATREHESRVRRDLFLWALIAFTVASGLSAALSSAQNRAIFGDFERLGGVWALLHFVMYYAMLRVFFGEREWKRFLRLSVAVSAIVAGIAVLQYQIAFAGTVSAGTFYSAVFSTIGNPGMLGMYLFFGVGFALYLALTAGSRRAKIIYAVIAVLDLYGIVLSQNRTSILGVVAALAVGAFAYALLGLRRRALVLGIALGVGAVFSGGLAIAIKAPSSAVASHLPGIFRRAAQTTLAGPDAIRFLQWRAAIEGFADHPIVGYGPENFHLAWSAHFQPELYGKITEERIDRAHNAVLEVLATTGLLGTITFLAMWGFLFYAVWRSGKEGRVSGGTASFFIGLFAGYLVILLFWFLDINSVPSWLGASAMFAFVNSGNVALEFGPRHAFTRRSRVLMAGGGLVLGAALWLHTYETLRVSHLLFRTQTGEDIPATLHDYFEVFASAAPQTSHTPQMYGRYMSMIIQQAPQFDDRTRKLVDTAFARGIVEMERERKRDPLNELVYIQQARLSLLAASYYRLPQYYDFAVETLHRAVALNPRRIQPRMVLAYALMMGGNYDDARAQLLQAKSIYARSGQVYYYMGHLLHLQNDFPSAAAALDTSIALRYNGASDLYMAVIDGLKKQEKFTEAAVLLEKYLGLRVSTYRPEGSRVLRVPTAGQEIQLMARLPVLWARADDSTRVQAAIGNLLLADSAFRMQAQKFSDDYRRHDLSAWIKTETLYPPVLPGR